MYSAVEELNLCQTKTPELKQTMIAVITLLKCNESFLHKTARKEQGRTSSTVCCSDIISQCLSALLLRTSNDSFQVIKRNTQYFCSY